MPVGLNRSPINTTIPVLEILNSSVVPRVPNYIFPSSALLLRTSYFQNHCLKKIEKDVSN